MATRTEPAPAPRRWTSAGASLVVAFVWGVAFAVLLWFTTGDPTSTLLAGWVAAAGVYASRTLLWGWRHDAAQTATAAQREDPSRTLSDVLLVVASLAALLAVALVIFRGQEAGPLRLAVGIVAIVAAWASVHVSFAQRYARRYYSEPVGGIDFNDDERPAFRDFVYLAFTVGMTYQVSDTVIQARDIRAEVLRHALVSFVFGAVILAVTINIVAGLGSG